ncbi:hypothetical protein EBU99_07550 [bacterium]|nr:hypothetical protein [bacterium]
MQNPRLRGGLIQYGLSVGSGLANFVGLKILQHISPSAEIYSRLSLLLLSFTTFQLLADLGTQIEFLRIYKKNSSEKRSQSIEVLLKSRLTLGLGATLIAAIYAAFAGFTVPMAIAFIIYQGAFIPFAVVSTADSILLAEEQFAKAILSRISRLFALGAFLATAVLLSCQPMWMIALSSTLTFALVGMITWIVSLKPRLDKNFASQFLRIAAWAQQSHEMRAFARGSALAAMIILFQFAQGFLGQSYLVRRIGEENLSDLNTALALATPAVLALQTLTQLLMPSVAGWPNLSLATVRNSFIVFCARATAVLVLMSAGLWTANKLGWVVWFFPKSTAHVVPLSLLYLVAHWLLNLAAPTLVLAQYKKKATGLLNALLAATALSFLVQWILTDSLRESAFLIGLIAMGLVLFVSSYFVAGLSEKQS